MLLSVFVVFDFLLRFISGMAIIVLSQVLVIENQVLAPPCFGRWPGG